MIGYLLMLMLTLTGCLGFLILFTTPFTWEREGTVLGAIHAITGVFVIGVTAYITHVVQP